MNDRSSEKTSSQVAFNRRNTLPPCYTSDSSFVSILNIILLSILTALGFINTILIMLKGYNSDRLQATALYNAIIVERLDISGWNFAPAPSFFPDMPLFFISKWLIHDLFYSHALYVFFLLAIIVYFSIKLFNMLNGSRFKTSQYGTIAMLYLSTVLSFPNSGRSELLYPIFHGGEIVFGIVILVLSVYIIASRCFTVWTFTAQLILSILMIASDKLIISEFLAPIIAAMFIMFLFGLIDIRITSIFFICYLMGWFISELILWYLRVYLHLTLLPINNRWFSWDIFLKFINDIKDITISPEIISTILCFLISVITLIISRKYLCRDNPCGYSKSEAQDLSLQKSIPQTIVIGIFLAIFFLCQLLISIPAPIITCHWGDLGSMRYFSALWFVSPILFIWLVFFILSNYRNIDRIKNIIIIILISLLLYNNLSFLINNKLTFNTPYPQDVECIDNAAREYSVKYAYSGYWMANYTTCLSKTGIKVNQWAFDLNEYHCLNHDQWYKQAPLPNAHVPVMIIPKDLDVNGVLKKFGSPKTIKTCPEIGEIYLYF